MVTIYQITPMVLYLTECTKHCSLCWNSTECYECSHGYFLDEGSECKRKQI